MKVYEYQINVATYDGMDRWDKPMWKFLFRTEWIENPAEAYELFDLFTQKFPQCNLTLSRRDRVRDVVVEHSPAFDGVSDLPQARA